MPAPVIGVCSACGRKLMLTEDGMCLECTIDDLRERLLRKDVQIEALRRRQKQLYDEISTLRRKLMEV